METLLEPILAELDYRVVIGAVAILLIVGVLALVKKVIKVGIVVIILALSLSTLGPMAQSFQENYKFNVENGAIHIVLSGNEYTIDKDLCEEINMTSKGIKGYELEAVFEDGTLRVMIPTFMMGKIQAFGNKHGIPMNIQ